MRRTLMTLRTFLAAIIVSLNPLESWTQQSPPGAQTAPKEPIRLEPTVVTATRTERTASEIPEPVIIIPTEEIREAPAITADNLIRNVPGINLAGGSSSVTHPTAQSIGIRGVGSNRALILLDGVPINDSFGGWVNWSKVPLPLVDRVEVLKGGGSSLYGTYAMGGVINILTKIPERRNLVLEGGYGTQDTYRFNLYGSEVFDNLALSLNGNYYRTDGYKVVPDRVRGPVDKKADSDNHSVNLKADYRLTPNFKIAATVNGFQEKQNVGTPLTDNARDTLDGSVLATLGLGQWGELKSSLFTEKQEFRNTNSRVGPGRVTETIALRQTVPVFDLGGSLQWSRHVSDFWDLLNLGVDLRRIGGKNREKIFCTTTILPCTTFGQFLRNRNTEGTQFASGFFGEAIMKPLPSWQVSFSARGDYWRSYDAKRVDGGALTEFKDQDHMRLNPKMATKYQLTENLAVRGAFYRAVRFPTLNELYRGFFAGNINFEGNPTLGPEELRGGEVGFDLAALEKRLTVRLTPFYNITKNLITFVTKSPTLRQRENVGDALSEGVEVETSLQLLKELAVSINYAFTDARVQSSQGGVLDGKRVPNVPKQQVTPSVRFSDPAIGNVTVRGRYLSKRFADDLNHNNLDRHFVLDISASREIFKGVELFAIWENVTNVPYIVSRSGTLGTLGAPFQFFGGLRFAAF